MKKQLELNQATRLINCGALVLVTAAIGDKATITPCAWHMPLSKDPALLAIALAKKHFSTEAIQASKEFALNIPQWHLLNKVFICGSVSGRDVDKFQKAGLTKEKARSLAVTPLIGECSGHLECKLKSQHEEGDHCIFTGEISAAIVEGTYFENNFWDTRKAKLIFHLGGKAFFTSSSYNEFI